MKCLFNAFMAENVALNKSMAGYLRLFPKKAFKHMDESGSWFWWGKNFFMGIVSAIFLILGIETLMTAYSLNNPLEFIMYFFSASLIILISLVGIIYPAFRIHTFYKSLKNK